MFKKQLLSSTILWLVIIFLCLGVLYNQSSDSKKAYQQLMSLSDQMKKEYSQEKEEPSQQTRKQVSKQIIYTKGKDRLQIRLTGDESQLIYSKKEAELVEQFKGLNCIMQDEIIFGAMTNNKEILLEGAARQMIRELKAEEAVYSYKSGKLEAKEIQIAHYLLPGIECPLSLEGLQPLFQGKAYRSQLSIFKEPSMQAQGFQAVFHDWENGW